MILPGWLGINVIPVQPIPTGPLMPIMDFGEPPRKNPFEPEPIIEQWNIHGAQDELCLQYDGTVWEQGYGPQPEADTHPNCKCTRDVFVP